MKRDKRTLSEIEVDPPTEVRLEVLNPRAEVEVTKPIAQCPGVADLCGKRVGLVDNTKLNASGLLASIAESLRGRFHGVEIKKWRKKDYHQIDVELYKQVATESDVVVYAIGD